jgi:hypothetical protein
VPGLHGGDAERDQQVALARAGRPDQAQVLGGGDPFQRGQVGEGGFGTVDTPRSNSSRVLVTGNAAALRRVRALEASRALISASTRVRSSSSGVQRWVFAVRSSSGGELPHRGQFQPVQPFGEVGGQRRRGRGHDSPPMA